MYTLLLDSSYPVKRRPYAPVRRNNVGSAGMALGRKVEAPYYDFTVMLSYIEQEVAEALAGFAAYHMGDVSFWFDGGGRGDITTPALVGFGDGVTTQFHLPNRNVFGPSLVMDVNYVVNTSWTIDEPVGLVTFTSAPAANAVVRAARYRCKHECVFWYEGDFIYTEEEFHKMVFKHGEIGLREIP